MLIHHSGLLRRGPSRALPKPNRSNIIAVDALFLWLPLKQILDQRVREAAPELYEKLDRNRVRCYACGH